ncbi:hypothetical protein VNO78_13807 [Psophocarpus tetragonolobus]|uniref:Uncharacterized protein n=1 Tax=Psophocarpus tetragonolobus TaxID=3891 RepID=A0AAN9XPR7_PSOTE
MPDTLPIPPIIVEQEYLPRSRNDDEKTFTFIETYQFSRLRIIIANAVDALIIAIVKSEEKVEGLVELQRDELGFVTRPYYTFAIVGLKNDQKIFNLFSEHTLPHFAEASTSSHRPQVLVFWDQQQ